MNQSRHMFSTVISALALLLIFGMIFLAVPTAYAQQYNILLNPGFESGRVDWTEHSAGSYGIITEYEPEACSGNWFARMGGYAAAADYLYQDVTIPADALRTYLNFSYRIGTEERTDMSDLMSIEVRRPSDGALLATLENLSNLDATPKWQLSSSYDMSSFKGQTIGLGFACTTNSALNTDFFIDDVALMMENFADVPAGDWAYDYITAIYNGGITMGCVQDPMNYCPYSNVTRSEMAAFIVRAKFGEDFTYPVTPYFTDVPSSHPFFRYIQKLREANITTGCTTTQYCPANAVTRQEMAAFIVRAKFNGDLFPYTETPYFLDVADGSQFFSYIQKMKDEGITLGCTATEYCPDSYVTRAQMAAFLARTFLNGGMICGDQIMTVPTSLSFTVAYGQITDPLPQQVSIGDRCSPAADLPYTVVSGYPSWIKPGAESGTGTLELTVDAVQINQLAQNQSATLDVDIHCGGGTVTHTVYVSVNYIGLPAPLLVAHDTNMVSGEARGIQMVEAGGVKYYRFELPTECNRVRVNWTTFDWVGKIDMLVKMEGYPTISDWNNAVAAGYPARSFTSPLWYHLLFSSGEGGETVLLSNIAAGTYYIMMKNTRPGAKSYFKVWYAPDCTLSR